MKRSNKILFGGLGLIILTVLVCALIARANTTVWTNADCHALPTSTITIADSFYRVEFGEGILATLTQGDFKVNIEAAEELISSIQHEVTDGVLKIYLEDGDYPLCGMKVDIHCPKLRSMKIANGSNISTVGVFETPSLYIETMNGSSVDFELKCDQVTTSSMNSARMKFAGSIGQLHVTGSNSANIDALNAQVSNAKVTLSNSASAVISADTISQANLVNSASLRYKGEAVLGQIRTNNSSSIDMIK